MSTKYRILIGTKVTHKGEISINQFFDHFSGYLWVFFYQFFQCSQCVIGSVKLPTQSKSIKPQK